MSAITQLRELSLANSRTRYPDMPEYARSCRNYTDKTANGLTKCIIDFLKFSGWQAERISNTGRYIDNTKIVSDCIDRKMRIGSGKWIPGSGQKGTADISATINGRSVKIEIKIGFDRQSENQKRYQTEIERAGGIYILCHSFTDFLTWYNSQVK